MESAIPAHLTAERSIDRRLDETFTPPYPAWVARFSESVEGVVMAYVGVQAKAGVPDAAFGAIESHLAASDGPRHIDRARYADEAGYDTRIAIGYWDEPAAFDRWCDAFRAWWEAATLGADGCGYFIEIIRPRVERFETLFSTLGRAEGIAVLADGMSEPIVEHAYWGSARERIPLAQTDKLRGPAVGGTSNARSATDKRIRIEPLGNLCVIRSGQDWSETTGDERASHRSERSASHTSGRWATWSAGPSRTRLTSRSSANSWRASSDWSSRSLCVSITR